MRVRTGVFICDWEAEHEDGNDYRCAAPATMRVRADGLTSHLCPRHWAEVEPDLGKGGIQSWQEIKPT
jgi:hypothetical protein